MLGLPYVEPGFATIERVDGANGGGGGGSGSGQSPRPSSSPSSSSSSSSSAPSGRWESEVHGVLHRISVADWTQVMATEGVGAGKSGYLVVEVEVARYDGRRVRALTLEGQPPSLHAPSRPVSPSARYLNLLRDGARHHGVDPEYIRYLDSLVPYDGSGWNAAVGRAVALGVAVPLALPLLPPVFLLRMARNRTRQVDKQNTGGGSGGDGGGDGGDGGGGGGGASGPTAADCSSTADCAEAASKAAVTSARDPVGPAATVTSAAASTAESEAAAVLPAGGGELPPQLLRPPLVLPAVASGYVRALQYATWAVHDLLAATPLGSGASNGAGGGDDDKARH